MLYVLVILMAALLSQADDSKVKPVEVLRTGDYSEGVVLDYDGSIFFSHGKAITIVTPDGSSRVWAETGAPNGHKILADGTHLVCDGSQHSVLHLDKNGKLLPPASNECDGKPLRAPNDLTLDPAGGFYFTDPGSSEEKAIGTIHFVDAKGVTHLAASGLLFPNGIVLTPDRKKLYVSESMKDRVLVYDVLEPGELGPLKVFGDLPRKQGDQIDDEPDGMCLDAAGSLYVAHYGMRQVQVLDPSGKLIHRYDGGNLKTSNVAFGGSRLDQLFVTGGDPGALFRLDLGVKGLDIRPMK